MVKLGPWVPDQPYMEGALAICENAIPNAEWYAPLPTAEAVTTSAVSGTVKGGFASRLVNGAYKTYIGTASKIYERNGAGWTDVSTGTYTLTTTDARWGFTQWEQDIYAVSYDETLTAQTNGTGSFTTIAGAPAGNCIANVREWVVVGDLNESGTRVSHKVRWCDIGDPSSWSSPGSNAAIAAQAGAQSLDSKDGKVMGIAGGEFAIILQQTAITRMSYIGAPVVWQFDKIDDRHGCESAGSIVQVGRQVFYLSHDGFRVTDGSGASQPIGDGFVTQWVRDNLNASYKDLITGAYDAQNRVIMWSIPTSTNVNDSLLIYSLQSQRWATGTYGLPLIFPGVSASVTLEGLDAYSSTLEGLPAPLDSNFWIGGAPILSAVDSSGYLMSFTGTPGTARWESNSYQPNPGGRTFVKSVEPIIDGTCTVAIGTKNLPSDALTFTNDTSPNSRTGQANFRSASRYIRVRIKATGDFSRADGYNLEAVAEGVA